ncbi:hypothetical protein ONZ51_g8812 [Trametes cubensis]|uniref:Uncharacterized protein n=1 Tax=Trametes cubensis TaxID=1111947 RepID=A0AAD7TMJ4_9APHY|nr:hypothetical protein ONZ51_g8812 [Trametes cubensis]
MPAPDYDTHSFVNVPPPLPIPPSSSSGTGSRPPARRQLTVVNVDVPPQSDGEPPQPTLRHVPSHPTLNLSHSSSTLSASMSMALSMCPPPSPGDPLRLNLNPRISYAESVYEVPPPAYDAIDFSVQYVPPVPPIPAHLAVVNAPMPVPPSGGEGQRPS